MAAELPSEGKPASTGGPVDCAARWVANFQVYHRRRFGSAALVKAERVDDFVRFVNALNEAPRTGSKPYLQGFCAAQPNSPTEGKLLGAGPIGRPKDKVRLLSFSITSSPHCSP